MGVDRRKTRRESRELMLDEADTQKETLGREEICSFTETIDSIE